MFPYWDRLPGNREQNNAEFGDTFGEKQGVLYVYGKPSVNFFYRRFHVRCLREFGIRLCIFLSVLQKFLGEQFDRTPNKNCFKRRIQNSGKHVRCTFLRK